MTALHCTALTYLRQRITMNAKNDERLGWDRMEWDGIFCVIYVQNSTNSLYYSVLMEQHDCCLIYIQSAVEYVQ